MAITIFEKTCNKRESEQSSHCSGEILPSSEFQTLSLFTENGLSGCQSRCSNNKSRKKKNTKSPYLANDNVHLDPTPKDNNNPKRAANIVSSFPLAVNIYKANSDEFKAQRRGFKKIKKSVLTLPNVPAIVPQTCTVSDMNDSDYSNIRNSCKPLRTKKRRQAQKEKTKVQNKDYVFYDRDARFCSQMNISCNSSSTDMMKFTGDGKRVFNKSHCYPNKEKTENKLDVHDIWAVLRNINRFQFRPSPPVSDNSSIKTSIKKAAKNKRRNNFRDNGVIETTRTEEFAYISSFDFGSKLPYSFSHSSSLDRITVIDNQEEFREIQRRVEESTVKRNTIKLKPQVKRNRTNRNIIKNNGHYIASKEYDNKLQQNKNITQVDQEIMISPEIGNISKEIAKNKNKPVTLNPTLNHATVKNEQSKGDTKENTSKEMVKNKYKPVSLIPTLNHATVKNEQSKGDTKITDVRDGKTKYRVALSTVSKYKSKEDFDIKNIKSKDAEVQVAIPDQNIKGITKVILSKGRNTMEPSRKEEQKRKLRSSNTILRNEPLNTNKNKAITINNRKCGGLELGAESRPYSPKQKSFVDKNVDPTENIQNPKALPHKKCDVVTKVNLAKSFENKRDLTKYKVDEAVDYKVSNQRRTNEILENKTDYYKQSNFKNKEPMMNKKERNHTASPSEVNKFKVQHKNPKPVQQIPGTVLKLLFKNDCVKRLDKQLSENNNIGTNTSLTVDQVKGKSYVKANKMENSTQTFDMPSHVTTQGLPKAFCHKDLQLTNKPLSNTRNSWAKRKWASEFIENVIKKIRNGIYYNQENISQHKTKPIHCLNHMAVQTLLSGKNITKNASLFVENKEVTVNDNDFAQKNIVAESNNDLLPGFDPRPPSLEIKTLNMKEVSICHCTANVIIQFDVTHLLQSNYHNVLLKQFSFVPLIKNETQAKILKCKTAILNAVLPAELCSMIPAVLKEVIHSTKFPTLPAIKSHQNDSNLYTISELVRNENPLVSKCDFSTSIYLSPDLKNGFEGIYKLNMPCNKTSEINKPKLDFKYCNYLNILPNSYHVQRLFPIQVCPANLGLPKFRDFKSERPYSTCTALQLYNPPKYKITTNTPLEKSTIKNLLEQMWDQDVTIRFKIFMPLKLGLDNCNKIVTLQINKTRGQEEDSDTILSIELNSLINGMVKQNNILTESPMKMIEYKNNPEKIEIKEIQSNTYCIKPKKKSSVKLYKKCKSTCNISGEKCSIPLSKITNLDEFFQIIGNSAKIMSSIFDGNVGNKILFSLSEMRHWVNEINPRQAMLVLLLINKKDTPNLVRFRPLLLQGIAVNRITRATELDMEIEVFEREDFSRFSQYKGIPYNMETAENSNNLLEELFWIAKTTASDYQKPFDESSEILLKSLLEKRKQLNPSYLRVMARYVGLGLLKTPRRK